MKKLLLILGGAILIAAGVAGVILWWWDELYLVIKGVVGLSIALAGIILIAVGATEGPETSEIKPEETKKEESKI
ncbi:MAG: hypothetical protein AB1465_02830 [Patescibacteria group bacterium]